MAWQGSKTWTDQTVFNTEEANRIEGNIEYLAGNGAEQQLGTADDVTHADLTVDDIACDSVTSLGAISGTTGTFSGAVSGTTGTFSGNVSGTNGVFSGALQGASINTGHGAFEVGQDLRTTDAVTFASVNTGAGANELYPMNQAVRTTDTPTFAAVKLENSSYLYGTTTYGAVYSLFASVIGDGERCSAIGAVGGLIASFAVRSGSNVTIYGIVATLGAASSVTFGSGVGTSVIVALTPGPKL